ncbi:MAG: hypothetical protein O7F12_02200 [Nitrospirae bacterium]|nr:hypothetical protein [Nitrospirota bacterium]
MHSNVQETVESINDIRGATPQISQLSALQKVVVFGLFLAIQGFFAFGPTSPLMEDRLAGPDSYMRVNRVNQLHETGDWQNALFLRSNAPFGEVLHWTRPLDAYLMLGGSLGSLLGSFETGLWVAGMLLGPLTHGLALCGILWIGKRLFPSAHLVLLGCLFLMQPGLTAFFMSGSVDHHSLLLMLCVWIIGLVWVQLPTRSPRVITIAAGLAVGLALWVSIESIVAIGVCLASLWGVWLWGDRDLPAKALVLFSVTLGVLIFALLVERPWSELLDYEYDKVSIVYVFAIFLAWAFWVIAYWVERKILDSAMKRVGFCVIWGIIAVLCIGAVFPKMFYGPLVDMDLQVVQLFLSQVLQVQPLIDLQDVKFGPMLFWLGLSVPAIPFVVWLAWKETKTHRRIFWFLMILGIAVFVSLTFYQVRWAGYASIFLIFPYAEFLGRIARKVRNQVRGEWTNFVYGVSLFIGTIWAFLLGLSVIQVEGGEPVPLYRNECPLQMVTKFLEEDSKVGENPLTIVTYLFSGPELLYRTNHRVVGTPYHRNRDGIVHGHIMLNSFNIKIVEELVRRRGVDLFVLCPGSKEEQRYYNQKAQSPTFYQKLLAGEFPLWVHPLVLPPWLSSHFQIFQVDKDLLSRST